jgi:RNA polymerase sigma factor (TIGR02999 family)
MDDLSVTQLLEAHRRGDGSALNRAFASVYEDLRHAASVQLRRAPGATLNTTSLVNEAYLRLADRASMQPADRAHFLAIAARAMRHIIVDYARKRSSAKRGGAAIRVDLDQVEIAVEDQARDLLVLDDALRSLARLDGRLVQVVECRFFTGMTEEETAAALDTSLSTVQRDWKRARAWLREEMDAASAR